MSTSQLKFMNFKFRKNIVNEYLLSNANSCAFYLDENHWSEDVAHLHELHNLDGRNKPELVKIVLMNVWFTYIANSRGIRILRARSAKYLKNRNYIVNHKYLTTHKYMMVCTDKFTTKLHRLQACSFAYVGVANQSVYAWWYQCKKSIGFFMTI